MFVETVGQLNEDDPDVFDHGQNHLCGNSLPVLFGRP